MNASMTIYTNGKGATFSRGCIRFVASKPGVLVAVVRIEISGSGTSITLHFEAPEEMIAFCAAHNIPYEDKRDACA